MTSPRLYRAACPNCGAPVEFRSAASAMAVCSYCSSTILRDGDSLRRIGRMAELFEDHSPVRIGATGQLPANPDSVLAQPANAAFMVVGRLQYRYADGLWNEWSLLFDDGQTLWLSEDNGRYAISRDIAGDAASNVPPASRLTDGSLTPGVPLTIAGRRFELTSIVRVTIGAAAGELPRTALRVAARASTPGPEAGGTGATAATASPASPASIQPPRPEASHWIVEGRSTDGVVASISYADPDNPSLSLGAPLDLRELRWQGLADESVATFSGRSVECPSCGASIQVKLTGTQSVVCNSCSSVLDLTQPQSVGGDLQHYRQQRRFVSPIPLGSRGKLFDVEWQAVGFARRSGHDEDGYDFNWREVLLFDPAAGFAFIVVASDGVSFVRTVQDSPRVTGSRAASYDGRNFRLESRYTATVDYVEGEFYWRVRADQQTGNIDYLSGDRVLSREQEAFAADGSAAASARTGAGGGEVVWSYGQRVRPAEVAAAFGMPALAATGVTAGMPIAAGNSGGDGSRRFDAPAYDPNDMPRGLGAGAAAAAAQAAAAAGASNGVGTGTAASGSAVAGGGGGAGLGGGGLGGGGGPTSGSSGVFWLIVIVVIILILVFLVVSDWGGGGGGYSGGGYSGGGGFSGSHK